MMHLFRKPFERIWISDHEGAVEVAGTYRKARVADVSLGRAVNNAMIVLAGRAAEKLAPRRGPSTRKAQGRTNLENDEDLKVLSDVLLERFGGPVPACSRALNRYVQAKADQLMREPSIAQAVHALAMHLLREGALSQKASKRTINKMISKEAIQELRIQYAYI